ncbi:hypothetical protein QTJ16_002472 [Diplocarpon rosae]|uniref:Uncharacterized protein n=1 Tax=Diplocarpon rosae TaxID=946125 RepID=A0AAD9WG03_9HELO|nr:hypothetical protein QTJ16_002472 [Diplocarpon rosae]PBP20730.1 hypothetical protein BUE80_DR008272 [Diplocarpon rosae]
MKFPSISIILGLAGLINSLDMTSYSEGPDIDEGFKAYLTELYLMTEDPIVTTTFSDFFTTDGQLIVRATVATGSDEIIALKQRLLPTLGNKRWNHRPNVTTVDSESCTEKVFQVLGVIETSFKGGNCSQAYYSARFHVLKDASGALSMETHAGNLAVYHDFIVEPPVAPTNIACGN